MRSSAVNTLLFAGFTLAGPVQVANVGNDELHGKLSHYDGKMVGVSSVTGDSLEIPLTPYNASADAFDDVTIGSHLAKRQGPIASTYQAAVINHHNYHRANSSSPNIAWSADLAASSLEVAKSCVWAHNTAVDGGGYGQNIAVGLPGQDVSYVISDLFYNNEAPHYDGAWGKNPNMKNFDDWGHMSQVVWKHSKHVGCATVDCTKTGMKNWPFKGDAYFTVCNYKPPGNYAGQYAANVGKRLGKPTVTGDFHIKESAIAAGPWPGKKYRPSKP